MTAPARRFLLVGLTGGIATGKSTVSEILARLGAVLVDADQLAREVVAPGEPALAEVVREFGDVLRRDGTLDRKKLAAIVFAEPSGARGWRRSCTPRSARGSPRGSTRSRARASRGSSSSMPP